MAPNWLQKISRAFQKTPAVPDDTPLEAWTIEVIRFATKGWRLGTTGPSAMTWSDPADSVMTLVETAGAEVLNVDELAQWRDLYRKKAERAGGGIVSVEIRQTAGRNVLEVIVKQPHGRGFDFESTLVIPADSRTFTITIKATEGATSGLREAMVSSVMLELGEVAFGAASQPGGPRPVIGFRQDPYDARWDESAIHTVTDDERVDLMCPDHPLSWLRRQLRTLHESISLDDTGDMATHGASADAQVSSVPRRLLSDVCIRELLWRHERFDVLQPMIEGAVAAAPAPEIRAHELLLLGIVQGRMSRPLEGLKSLTLSLEIMSAGADEVLSAVTRMHLARAISEVGDLDEAQQLLLESLKVLEKRPPNDLVLAMALNSYGTLLIKSGSPQEAMPYVLRAQDLVQKAGGGQRFFQLLEHAGSPAPELQARTRVVP